jgi:hypothetical protein
VEKAKMTDQMSPVPPSGADFAEAKRQVGAIKGFYIHLAVYAVVMLLLLAINAGAGGRWWVHWVLFGWGIGVIAHALAVYGRAPRFVAEWEQRKLSHLMNKPR